MNQVLSSRNYKNLRRKISIKTYHLLKHVAKHKKLIFLLLIVMIALDSCRKKDPPAPLPKTYPADVAVEWMKLNMKLTQATPGFNSVVSFRSFGYAGLTLYESLAGGITGAGSMLPLLNNSPKLKPIQARPAFWPASANAAMARITRSLFGNASPAGKASIDSLEAVFTEKFRLHTAESDLAKAEAYGRSIADFIFEWSKTDGGHEAYLHVTSPEYIPPTGAGNWIPTPPLYSAPIHPYWGKNRSFVAGIANQTQPAPPIMYSADVKSPFYQMVNELYTISLSLTHEDSTIAKFWADIPGNFNVPAHAANIVTQLIVSNKIDLAKAALIYATHGIATSDAAISVFKTKYQYNLVRPISYIRNVMGHTNWNTVVPTPPHPEYTAAHAVTSSASATVLEHFFGKHYYFTDRTYENIYGARSYASFEDYALESGRSRVLGGIHYSQSIATGIEQGRKIGQQVTALGYNGY